MKCLLVVLSFILSSTIAAKTFFAPVIVINTTEKIKKKLIHYTFLGSEFISTKAIFAAIKVFILGSYFFLGADAATPARNAPRPMPCMINS